MLSPEQISETKSMLTRRRQQQAERELQTEKDMLKVKARQLALCTKIKQGAVCAIGEFAMCHPIEAETAMLQLGFKADQVRHVIGQLARKPSEHTANQLVESLVREHERQLATKRLARSRQTDSVLSEIAEKMRATSVTLDQLRSDCIRKRARLDALKHRTA